MSDLLRQYTPAYVARWGARAVPHVQSVLAKLVVCRTAALGGHVYECPQCQQRCPVYNSCRDRHCPQCRGGRRADWLAKTAELLLPQIDYFQVVFTVPAQLSALMLGQRRETYRLLFHAAWKALDAVLREELGCEPAALLVLHTWNQRLGHHPHVHALVPGGGPALAGGSWIRSRHRQHHGRRKPYLVDNRVLSARFRDQFLAGLTRLHRDGQLKLDGPGAPGQDAAVFAAWLQPLRDADWVVFIEPPPTEQSHPEQVLKYLARYLTGGPLSDRRLLAHHDGQVSFWVRGRDKATGNRSVPHTLPGAEFTRRWALHILPKGFVKSRCFGGFSGRHRAAYLRRCRELLADESPASEPSDASRVASPEPAAVETSPPARLCPHCQTPMACLAGTARRSWSAVMNSPARPAWYAPFGRAAAPARLPPSPAPPDG